MIKSKKGFYAKEWLIASIIFGGIIALVVIMVGGFTETYNSQNIVDSQFSESYDHFSETTVIADDMYKAASSKEGIKIFAAAELLYSSTFTIIGLIWNTLSLPGVILGHFAEDFGIPTSVMNIFSSILITILVIMIIWAVVGSISRRDM